MQSKPPVAEVLPLSDTVPQNVQETCLDKESRNSVAIRYVPIVFYLLSFLLASTKILLQLLESIVLSTTTCLLGGGIRDKACSAWQQPCFTRGELTTQPQPASIGIADRHRDRLLQQPSDSYQPRTCAFPPEVLPPANFFHRFPSLCYPHQRSKQRPCGQVILFNNKASIIQEVAFRNSCSVPLQIAQYPSSSFTIHGIGGVVSSEGFTVLSPASSHPLPEPQRTVSVAE